LSIDNLLVAVYSIYMSATECQEKGTQKRWSKKRFVTQKIKAGVSKSAVVMPGAEFTAQTTTKIAGVVSSALQVSGARRPTHQIMANKFDEWSITALHGRQSELRSLI
jgi:hypothetical protein